MQNQKLREKRIADKLNLEKLPYTLKSDAFKALGSEISNFIHYVFSIRKKTKSLNWCFANVKRIKIFLQIFHANESGKESYKEEISKLLLKLLMMEFKVDILNFYHLMALKAETIKLKILDLQKSWSQTF
jgi:hypothetical protein